MATNHASLSILEDIKNNLDIKNLVSGVFIDLEKAFHTVNHNILIKKLDFYGIRGTSNGWFKSYLSARRQRVKYKDCTSEKQKINCGVPKARFLDHFYF